MTPPHWPQKSDWTSTLTPVFESLEFQSLQTFVAKERITGAVYPPEQDVFQAFRLTPLANVKVVILGQDPYHGQGQAHGLCFSVAENGKHPPSLKNIFRELADDLQQPLRKNGNLDDWANQGVLLLNTVLTVRAGQAQSHAKRGWESFTDHVIQQLGQPDGPPRVFLLWGKPAQKKSSLISPHHTILSAPHPSPLSAYRGFFGSRPFSGANDALKTAGRSPVAW